MFSVTSQGFVTFSTIVIFLLSAGLTFFIVKKYIAKKQLNLLFWSAGLIVFTVAVFLEILMADKIYSRFLIDFYLFLVAVLVQFLALGSFALFGNKKFLNYYYIYSTLATVFLVVTLIVSPVGNIINSHIVYGVLPLSVTISSSFVTFPAATFIILIAAISYKKFHSNKLLSIIAGVIIVAIAGTLYIAAIPVFLYYAEFIGILLLWLGFM
ncbi:hypothetical protein [Ferroplasma sp.]|uniref:hypothetical protein n=1 Tax=Ferroplasma sp. TaxID=2591003 RepID=UPI00307D7327